MPTLTFCGAAGTVTGSSSLMKTDSVQFMVDCGLFQGNRSVRELNWEPFPFDARRVDFLILTVSPWEGSSPRLQATASA